MKKKRFLVLIAGLLMITVGCLYFNAKKPSSTSNVVFAGKTSQVLPQDQERKSTYIIGVSQLPSVMQPYLQQTEGSFVINKLVFPSLATQKDGDYINLIANGIIFENSGSTAKVKVNNNKLFSDGCQVTADDIIYSYHFLNNKNIAYDSKSNYTCIQGMIDYQNGTTNSISGITKISDTEIQFDFSENNWLMFESFSLPIIHPKDHEYTQMNMKKTHLGCGSYQIEKYAMYQEIVLVKNTYTPQTEKYQTIKVILSDLKKLESQEIDTMIINEQQIDNVKSLESYQIMQHYSHDRDFILFNLNNETMSDRANRSALAESINVKKLVDQSYESGQLSKGILSGNKKTPNYLSLVTSKKTEMKQNIIFQFGFQGTEQSLYETLSHQLSSIGVKLEGRKKAVNSLTAEDDVGIYYYRGNIEDLLETWQLDEFCQQLNSLSLNQMGNQLEKYLVDQYYVIPLHNETYYTVHLCNKNDLDLLSDFY